MKRKECGVETEMEKGDSECRRMKKIRVTVENITLHLIHTFICVGDMVDGEELVRVEGAKDFEVVGEVEGVEMKVGDDDDEEEGVGAIIVGETMEGEGDVDGVGGVGGEEGEGGMRGDDEVEGDGKFEGLGEEGEEGVGVVDVDVDGDDDWEAEGETVGDPTSEGEGERDEDADGDGDGDKDEDEDGETGDGESVGELDGESVSAAV